MQKSSRIAIVELSLPLTASGGFGYLIHPEADGMDTVEKFTRSA
jgi:hypothetical protein